MNLCLRLGLIALAALALAAPARAFPTKPVRIIVPWPAGGSTDTIGRLVAQQLTPLLGQNVVIDNRAGGSGAIGIEFATRATPDGYSLAIIEVAHVVLSSTLARPPYNLMQDFAPITLIGTSPMILFVNAAVPAKSVAEFIALARAKPGAVLMAHAGHGSFGHLLSELMQQRTGVRFTQVGYKGAAPAFIELAGGQVQAFTATLASGAGTLKTGRIAALAVAGTKRLDALPAVPTLTESGIPDFVVEQWWGLVTPVKTPPEVLARLHRDSVAAIEHPLVRERVSELAVVPGTSSPQAFKLLIDAEIKRWARVAADAGVKPE
jgi:tripartite-type tricarboxylate transporter receptor subunit TctC